MLKRWWHESRANGLINSKLRATGIHLAISLIVFIVLLLLILLSWYPQPFFATDGGWQGIRLVTVIDLVIGPLLTLLLFNPFRKKLEIVLVLSTIAIMQLSALSWGVYIIYMKHPVAIVFFKDRFSPVQFEALAQQGYDTSKLEEYSNQNPPFIIALRADFGEELDRSLTKSTVDKITPFEQFELYHPFHENYDQIKEGTMKIDEILETRSRFRPYYEEYISKLENKEQLDSLYIFRYEGAYQQLALIFNGDGELIDRFPFSDEPTNEEVEKENTKVQEEYERRLKSSRQGQHSDADSSMEKSQTLGPMNNRDVVEQIEEDSQESP